ncbi:DUF4189 domain-containing protein [Stenotrophomonas indicatrix]|uniref:DUF4189 domain-containing protein n=1 Tax=Stenotrophomonas indicatrix TaxID=2045451 RepID=UPI003CCE86BA
MLGQGTHSPPPNLECTMRNEFLAPWKLEGAMHRVVSSTVLIALILCMGPALAEGGCPPGSYPIGGQGVQGCAPIPGTSSGASGPAVSAPPQPLGEWLTRWGAVAESPTSSLVGTSSNESSERRAVAVAIKKCAAEGAKDCKSSVTYYNQCVAFAVPSSGKGQGSLDTAVDAETVAGNAIEHCKDTGGGKCTVVYSECSLPVFKKF